MLMYPNTEPVHDRGANTCHTGPKCAQAFPNQTLEDMMTVLLQFQLEAHTCSGMRAAHGHGFSTNQQPADLPNLDFIGELPQPPAPVPSPWAGPAVSVPPGSPAGPQALLATPHGHTHTHMHTRANGVRGYGCGAATAGKARIAKGGRCQASSTPKIKRHKCSHCTKSFGAPSKLRRHEMTHTGEKPHMCSHSKCGHAFVQKEGLRIHSIKHAVALRGAGEPEVDVNGYTVVSLIEYEQDRQFQRMFR